MIDLMAIAAVDRETEVTYIRRERDWADRAAAEGRFIDRPGCCRSCPPTIAGLPGGNGHGNGNGHGRTGTATAARRRPRRTTSSGVIRAWSRSSWPLAVMGAVTGVAAIMLVLLGQDWDDALFWILAAVMLGSALAGRDDARHHPLRPGDDRLLRRPGRDLRRPRRAARRGRPGDRLHRRDQRPDPVRDHADPDQGRARRRLVFQTQAVPAAIAAIVIAVVIALAIGATDWGERRRARSGWPPTPSPQVLFNDFVLPFEIVSVLLLAAVIGGVFLAKREPGGPS